MYIEVVSRKPVSEDSSKAPILCVHGGYHAAWCWDEYFLPYFAERGHEAHAVSLRGHGKSDGHKNINRWGIADYVADVADAVSQLSTTPVLIGHSIGGIIVQKYLEQHPAPAGILLASSPLQGMMMNSLKRMLLHPKQMLYLLLTRNMLHGRPSVEDSLFSDDMPRERAQAYIERLGNESFKAFLDVASFDRNCPQNINIPILVVGGENDLSIPKQTNIALAKAYGTILETFPVAHDVMLDLNWEMVASRIVEWLQEI